LRKTLVKRGKLSPAIINETVSLPCTATYMQHFGSLREAYRLIGYASRRNCEYLDSRQRWADLTSELGSQVVSRLQSACGQGTFNSSADSLRVTERENISFRLAKWQPGKKENHAPYWSIKRRANLPAGWVIVIRLTERNKDVLDYLLLRSTDIVFPLMRFSEKARARRGLQTFEDFDALLRSLIRKIAMVGRVASAKQRPPSRSPTTSQPKTKGGRGRH
jgi:hypothetical protein